MSRLDKHRTPGQRLLRLYEQHSRDRAFRIDRELAEDLLRETRALVQTLNERDKQIQDLGWTPGKPGVAWVEPDKPKQLEPDPVVQAIEGIEKLPAEE